MSSDEGFGRKDSRQEAQYQKRKREDGESVGLTSNLCRPTFQTASQSEARRQEVKSFFQEEQLSEMFKDRFTKRDEEFTDYCKNRKIGPPPVIQWNQF